MKSRTSSCKGAALKKDLSRFWPVWAGYILCLIILQVIQSNDDLSYWYAANMAECISIMGLVNGVYGLAAAQMLFGDLFNARMCSGLHSLPLKREHWFSAHITAGFLFSLLPTALMTGFSEIIIFLYSDMVNGWQIPLYWFAASNIQYIFFFGVAVFAVMCTGNRFAATVVYGILNFFSLLVYLLVDKVYTPLLYGVVTMSTLFELLCPMYRIASLLFVDADRVETGKTYIDQYGVEQREYIGQFTVATPGWIYIGIIALVGIALLLLARRMYKKRNLECAGDFMAVRWLEPVFQVVFTVLCAAGFYAMFLLFFGLNSDYLYLLLGIGLIVGWFAGRMFLERSTRVFRLKNIAGFVLLAAVLAGSLYITELDPMGIEDWVPQTGELKSATLRMNYRSGYTTEDPAEMEDLIRLHALALEQRVCVHPDYDSSNYNPYDSDPEAVQIILQYETENGWTSQREYYVLAEGESGGLIREYCSRLEQVIGRSSVKDVEDLRYYMKDADNIAVNSRSVPEEYLTEEFLLSLADAIAADCEAGNMVQSGVFHPDIVIDIEREGYDDLRYLVMDINGMEFYCYLYVYADCGNTLAVLEPTGVIEQIRQDYENAYG